MTQTAQARIIYLAERREADRRAAFGVERGDTCVPIGYLASRLLDHARLQAAAIREREGRQ